jgi:hypothetical protein
MSSSYGQLLKDLQIGMEEGEKPVKEFLRSKFGIKTRNVGKKKVGWDLEVCGVDEKYLEKSKSKAAIKKLEKNFINKYGTTFEIKRDKASDRTNNFFYEVWSSSKVVNSGCMATTKADIIVIVRNKEFIFLNRGIFISWLVENLFLNTELGIGWRKNTDKKSAKPKMKTGKRNRDVSGILIPIEDIKKCPETRVFER